MKRAATVLTVLLVLVSLVPAASAASGQAYAGSHVSFDTTAHAVTNYAVNGDTMLSTVKVQSASDAGGSGVVGVGTSLSAVTSIDGAGLSLGAKTQTGATVTVDGSASMDAHDDGNGVLVVRAGGDSQYVQANLSDGSTASAESKRRVAVTTADGVDGSFIVVGNGTVAVNDAGNVVAKLGDDGQLVFKAYPNGKTKADGADEQLIADGQATAEVHVLQKNGGTVADTVTYGQQTSLDAAQRANGSVQVAVDRSTHQGTVVITSISKAAMDTSNGLQVTVDGHAAAKASSEADLRSAIGGDRSKYLVRSGSGAKGSATVLVAVNHFSKRTITMSPSGGSGSTAASGSGATTAAGSGGSSATTAAGSTGDSSGSNGAAAGATSTSGQPGFGAVVTLVGLLGAAVVALRRP